MQTGSIHPPPSNHELRDRLLSLVDGFCRQRVAVVGDLIADEFIFCHLSRVSRHAKRLC